MTITKDHAQMLAKLACDSRPTGARRWQPDKVMAQLEKLRGRSLGSVICATVRCAMDRNAEREECIVGAGSHWGDTMLTTDWVPNSVPHEERCSVCSKDGQHCRCEGEFLSAAMAAKLAAEATTDGRAAVIAALKDAAAHAQRPAAVVERDPAADARIDAARAALVAANPGLATPPMTEPEPTEPEIEES